MMAGLTQEQKKEEISVCFVHALAAQSGINFEIPRIDNDSVDAILKYAGKHEKWIISSPSIYIQLKATSKPKYDKSGNLKFPLPIKNYKELSCITQVPRLLIVLKLNHSHDFIKILKNGLSIDGIAQWICLQGRTKTTRNKKTISISIPQNNTLTLETFMRMIENVGLDISVTTGL